MWGSLPASRQTVNFEIIKGRLLTITTKAIFVKDLPFFNPYVSLKSIKE